MLHKTFQTLRNLLHNCEVRGPRSEVRMSSIRPTVAMWWSLWFFPYQCGERGTSAGHCCLLQNNFIFRFILATPCNLSSRKALLNVLIKTNFLCIMKLLEMWRVWWRSNWELNDQERTSAECSFWRFNLTDQVTWLVRNVNYNSEYCLPIFYTLILITVQLVLWSVRKISGMQYHLQLSYSCDVCNKDSECVVLCSLIWGSRAQGWVDTWGPSLVRESCKYGSTMSMSVIGSVYDIASGYVLNCPQVFNKWYPKLPRRYQEYVFGI
jgi:hypothetical protein